LAAGLSANAVRPSEPAEHLRYLERRIVRQHDPGAADADAIGRSRDCRHHDLGGGAHDRGMVVMLGDPEALVTQRLAMLRERYGVADGLPVRAAGDGDRLIEN
jgi:hypothetical protein